MKKFILKGHICPVCAEKIEKELQKNKNIKSFNFDKTNFIIKADGINLLENIINAVQKYEPGVKVFEETEESNFNYVRLNKLNFEDFSLYIGILFVIVSFILKNNIISILGAIFAGYSILRDGIKVLCLGGGFDEKILMSISMTGAIIIGEPFEGAMIMIFYRIGEAISNYALKRANNSIRKLISSQKVDARIVYNGISKLVDVEDVYVGTDIVVNPLEMVPIDSVVLDDYVEVDNSSFTGETDPIIYYNGEKIFSGAIVLNKTANLKTVSNYYQSSLYRMKILLEKASVSKSKQEKFLTNFSKIYTPIVVFIAIFVSLIPIINGGDFNEYLYKSLSFLVSACPCALVIGVPLSYAVGIAALSTKGILVKGSEYIDTISNITHIAMDKTGTVTENFMEIDRVEALSDLSEDELKKIMAIGEKYSKHPIARGFKMENMPDPKNYSELVGIGIDFSFDNNNYKIRGGELSGEIILYRDDNIVGKFFVVEKIKQNAKNVINSLRKMNIKSTLISGDKVDKVKYVSEFLNVDGYFSEQKPEDKLNIVNNIKKNHKIAFVGDGINDAPVLKSADVGISMGHMGSDSAIESSDVVITDDSFDKVIITIKNAKSIMKNVKFIIFLVLIFKFLTMLLIYLGYARMYLAVFADVGISILSIGIALMNIRLRKK